MSDKEQQYDTVEQITKSPTSESDRLNEDRINRFSPEEQKKIIRRIDRRLVLTLGFLYCVSLMDRTNLGKQSHLVLSLSRRRRALTAAQVSPASQEWVSI
jgi:hypothetical protein